MRSQTDLSKKKRIVIKIGSSSLTHQETGHLNLSKLEKLTRVLADLKNQGKDIILVSSGAIAVGRKAVGVERPSTVAKKQACAAVGQATLMMIYQKLFREYNQIAAQVLLTKETMESDLRRQNAENTFNELLALDVIPIVNENDTVSTEEIEFGDNDRLSAIVATLVGADLLILLSDIDGLYSDDPRKNPKATFVETVEKIDEHFMGMAKDTQSSVGTGGMVTKLMAAQIATTAGVDMVIANGDDVTNIERILKGENIGTLFLAHKKKNFDIRHFIL